MLLLIESMHNAESNDDDDDDDKDPEGQSK